MLSVEGLRKTYLGKGSGVFGRSRSPVEGRSDHVAVDDVSFEVVEGELFTLLGPSGCGKTTTLRSIAGLEHPESGKISVDGAVIFDGSSGVNVPVNRRGFGMVFQSYAIWPHMSVYDNVAFPLTVTPRARRLKRSEIRERVERALDVTGLTGLAGRSATKLSGGQQQRLALARATVMAPRVLLLDEPLSNLDAQLRESMRFELKRLQKDLGITSIYVTHDQAEALAISSRLAVMRAGKIEQIGRPKEVYTNPTTRFVAEFIGISNFLDCVVLSRQLSGSTELLGAGLTLRTSRSVDVPRGTKVRVSLRPETLRIASSGEPAPSDHNEFRGRVVTRAFLGESVDHIVEVGPLELRCRSTPTTNAPPGTEVRLVVDPQDVVVVAVSEDAQADEGGSPLEHETSSNAVP